MTEASAFSAISAAFARAPEQEHGLSCLINAAVRLHCRAKEAIRKPAVEVWEDGPHGVGMSDKAVREPLATAPGGRDIIERYRADRDAAAGVPEREGWAGRPTDCASDRCGSKRPGTPIASISPTATQTVRTASSLHLPCEAGGIRTGNALAEERGGIVHDEGSPIAAEFGPSDPAKRRVPRPVDPTIAAGDSA